MKVGKSVAKAIDELEAGDLDSAILHACNAVDGTAQKTYPTLSSGIRFTRLLRENYDVLGPMALPGINLVETRFPVSVRSPKAVGGKPDIADVIYGIHRCSHGHGDELPCGFELLNDAAGSSEHTRMIVQKGAVQLSDRLVFGLIAVAVLSAENREQLAPDNEYVLTLGTREVFPINEWWGRKADFLNVVSKFIVPNVTMNFGDWMA